MKFMIENNQGRGYREKPSSKDVGKIRNRFRAAAVADEEAFCDRIARGCVWMPGVMDGGMTRASWVSQQFVGLDFDNKDHNGGMVEDPLAPADVVDRLVDAGIHPMCVYATYSHTPEWPRFRVVICLSEMVEDPDVMEMAIDRLLVLFPEADQACRDLARLFFGTFGEEHVGRIYKRAEYQRCDIRTILALPEPEPEPEPEPVKRVKRPTRATHGKSIDIDALKDSVDLLALAQADAGETGRREGSCVKFHHCPICEHKDCFVYYPEKGIWVCYSDSNTTGFKGGDAISYVRARDGVSFKEAVSTLAAGEEF